jgi:hypothetical protein
MNFAEAIAQLRANGWTHIAFAHDHHYPEGEKRRAIPLDEARCPQGLEEVSLRTGFRTGRWPHAFISFDDPQGRDVTLAWGVGSVGPTKPRRRKRKT